MRLGTKKIRVFLFFSYIKVKYFYENIFGPDYIFGKMREEEGLKSISCCGCHKRSVFEKVCLSLILVVILFGLVALLTVLIVFRPWIS